jgi:DNA-directed RNA polymerase I, II, and III subunit RPABC1
MTSQQLDEQSTRLYRIRKTVMEMLRDRDYVVAEFELAFTKEAFREKYGDEPKREDLVIQKPKRSNTAEHVSFLCAPCNFYPAVKGFQGS